MASDTEDMHAILLGTLFPSVILTWGVVAHLRKRKQNRAS